MRKITLVLLIVLSVSAQHYRAGAGFTAGLPNDNSKVNGGFNIFLEYLTESPLSFRTSGGFAITKFSDSNPYLNDVNYWLYWIEGSLMYFPIQSDWQPYLGGGIGYYIINTEELNEVRTTTGNYIPQALSSKVSYHIKAGFSYPIQESIRLHIGGKYLFLKEKFIVEGEEIIDNQVRSNSSETEIDLSTLYLTLGVILRI